MATKIEYPRNLTLQGQLQFPLKSEAEIEAVKEWRNKKGHKKPKFADKIGASILVNQVNADRFIEYFEKTFIPFVETLYKDTDGDKGVDADARKLLLAQVKKRQWLGEDGKPNLPIRDLSEKELEQLGDNPNGYVAKIRFQGPWQKDLGVKAILIEDERQVTHDLDYLNDEGILPDGYTDSSKLWWGSGWTFRVSMRLHAYETASTGVSGYVNTLYLLPHLGLPTFSGSEDADVLEDGDDWME